MRNPKILIAFCIAFNLFFAAVRQTTAQTADYAVTVSPAQAYLKILPGNRATHTITVENTGTNTLEVTPKVVDFTADGKTGLPVLLGETEFAYLTITDALHQTITLAPRAKAQLTLSFNVPAGAKNKEYPLSIIFSASEPGNFVLDTDNTISGSVVSNLVVLVSDESELTKKIVLENFSAPKIVDSFDKITFAPVLKNEAYATAIASGSATLYNWGGKKVAEFPLYPDSILGFSTREIRSYEAEGEGIKAKLFSYDSPFLFGPYKLVLALDNSVEHATIIALPFSILIVALLGGLVFFAYAKISSVIVKN